MTEAEILKTAFEATIAALKIQGPEDYQTKKKRKSLLSLVGQLAVTKQCDTDMDKDAKAVLDEYFDTLCNEVYRLIN